MSHQFHHSTNLVSSLIINEIIELSFRCIASNQFVQKHKLEFTLMKAQGTLNNLVNQICFSPTKMQQTLDKQASPLREDSLMQVNNVQYGQVNTIQNLPEKSKVKQQKRNIKSMNEKQPEVRALVQKVERQNQSAFVALKQETVQKPPEEDNYVIMMRKHKQNEQQNTRSAHSELKVKKIPTKLVKGQKIVFDYEGKIEKGKNQSGADFEKIVLKGSINKPELNRIPKCIQQENRQSNISLNNLKYRSSPLRRSEHSKYEFTADNRAEIINSLELTDQRIKMIFDGQPILRTLPKTSVQLPKTKTHSELREIQKRKHSQRLVDQAANEEKVLDVSISLPAHAKKEISSRYRANTEISGTINSSQKINVESQSLKRVLLFQENDDKLKHTIIPTKMRQKRSVTQADNSILQETQHSYQRELIKIKEKLNIKPSSKLPKISNLNYQIQKVILREFRRRNNV